MTFLHWPVPPARVAPLLPPGTDPDVHDGTSWVGLIAFAMVGLGFGPFGGVPYLGSFLETNVRLYSVDRAGRRGVVFRSLEATRLLPVLVSRTWPHLPYAWSTMSLHRDGDQLTYRTRRRWPSPVGVRSELTVGVGGPLVRPSSLETFLTARWGLHTGSLTGGARYLPNAHPTWPLSRAELVSVTDGLVAAAGLPGIAGTPPVSVLYSPGVPVRFGPPGHARRASAAWPARGRPA